LVLIGGLAIWASASQEGETEYSLRRAVRASKIVDIHEIATAVWISTTTATLAAPSVAAMSTLDVSTTQHRNGRRPAPMLRLHVLAHRGRLDRLLAEGRSPATDPELAIRAAQLARPRFRARLAASLRDAVCALDDSALAQYLRPEIPVDAASVRACAREIDDLARALTGLTPHVRGVAIVRGLLTDDTGPLYKGGRPDQLRTVVLAARAAL
jgi:hypothetical protein